MRSPYQIFESIYPDAVAGPIYSLWFRDRKYEYLDEHPDAFCSMIDGMLFKTELEKFYRWLDQKYPETK